MRPLTVVDGDCGKIGADSSIGGMAAHVPLWVEAAPQRPQVAPERVRREVAWHLDLPLLEAAPPQERVAQEEYHRLPVVCGMRLDWRNDLIRVGSNWWCRTYWHPH